MTYVVPTPPEIDIGWTKLSLKGTWVLGFRSIFDYSPDSSFEDDAIGDHYDLYEIPSGYLLTYRIVGQRAAYTPGFVAAQGYAILPRNIGELIINHSNARGNPTPQDHARPRDDLDDVLKDIEGVVTAVPDVPDLADLRHDLREMKLCLSIGAFRGCLAMAGRVLESCLKAVLRDLGKSVMDDWMVGKLLSEMEAAEIYVDPAMKNVWNIINKQRIVGVHAKEAAPIPSREQAIMVAYAVVDTIKRRLAETA
jgi:hypothetical protein